MSFLGLCDGDPLVKTLTDVFGANIVRVPEQRVRPMTVLSSHGGKSSFRGALAPLLVGVSSLDIAIASSRMADVSGKRSRSVSLDLGLNILDGFLKGLGIPSAGISAKLSGASEVSFTFKNVVRDFVDIGSLGRALTGLKVDRENPAAAIFFQNQGYTFLVIDSVITSSDFSIAVTRKQNSSFALDVPAIQQIVSEAKVNVQVTTTTGYDLTFQGDKHLSFAFSCVRLYLSDIGEITALPPEDEVPALRTAFRKMEGPEHLTLYTPDRVLLNKGGGMLSWDE